MFGLRKTTILWGLFAAPLITLMLAGLGELAAPDGFVRFIAYGLAVGSGAITLLGLAAFLGVFLIQIWRHEGQFEAVVSESQKKLVFTTLSTNENLKRLGGETNPKFVLVSSDYPRARPLEFAPESLQRMLKDTRNNGGV